ncbi:helix-turn-helix transcriptional regulator [Kitasatospora sp. NPDC036755]|uniref:ArsR/SmtB family transcription factor n=1 Tax=Kitasatospora sp. NPDC036755 TaxID=3154600 RepID=UPI0033E49788
MVTYHPDLDQIPVEDVLAVLAALGDLVRLFIVRELASSTDPRTCGSQPVSVTKAAATHHRRALREAGITRERREGRTKVVELRRAELDARFPHLLGPVLAAAPSAPDTAPPA